ncbi:Sn1-specific diacylglycerol lipase beta [Seminavis robusta]|uniref:sn-1-specific diacylglycerol lipase n=1 Tax=Seminavis robusta TaxID=568900 RepID=A0A9N8EQN3_9STRA|nr:Sn1-specific diacylglycerol lipase beta [Seminavis robusta]|eukprot:Sro1450_g273810.1 Sn1-specific diacylglycerol lipase beta (724) ;mRNA; r:25097-27533
MISFRSFLLLLLAGQCIFSDGLPWGSLLQTTYSSQRYQRSSKPLFLARFGAQASLVWNGTTILDHNVTGGAFVADKGNDSDFEDTNDDSDFEDANCSDGGECSSDNESVDETTAISSDLRILKDRLKQAVTEQLRSIPSLREFLDSPEEESSTTADSSSIANDDDDNTEWSFLSRVFFTTKNSKLANTLTEQIQAFKERNSVNSTFDFVGAVSPRCCRRCCVNQRVSLIHRGGHSEAASLVAPLSGWDMLARNIALTAGKIVLFQCLVSFLAMREMHWVEQFADRILSKETATAVKTIRTILTNMEDHGVVDVFSKYSSQDVAAALYCLYRLQRATKRYETLLDLQEPDRHPEDLLHVLEDLSHYVVYANAAYGWKMDLAFKRKLHLGDEQALMKKTGIQQEDILKLSLKSKAHVPAYFLVRDRRQKALVLGVRGTWSAADVLTDLCCTAEEYKGPSDDGSRGDDGESTRQQYRAHHGMLEAAMAVAIDMEDMIEEELRANPDYSLVLVGHSMGAGVASLLATFWEEKFPNMKTYLFGGPCVAPLDCHPTNNPSIINVIREGDPFRCLSLGHVADVSAVVSLLCEEPDLRRDILARAEGRIDEMEYEDLKFCWETTEDLRENVMTNPNKMYPPGRIFHLKKQSKKDSDNFDDSDTEDDNIRWAKSGDSHNVLIHEVGPQFFSELLIRPRMFDISRHLPSLYEDMLRDVTEIERLRSAEIDSNR